MLKNKLPLILPERFDGNNVNAAKGILILLVILGHASNFWTPEPFATFSIKYFHVACFLLFPFIYDIKPISSEFLKNTFVRYYVPYVFFLIGYAVLFFLYARPETSEWLKAIGQSLILGNYPMLDKATGLRALWFMPVLISIVILNAIFIGWLKTPLWVLLIIGGGVHIIIGTLPDNVKFYAPMGLVNALYLMILGYLIRFLCVAKTHNYLFKNYHTFLFIFIAALFFSHYFHTLIKFPVIALPDYHNMQELVIHDIIILSAFMFFLTCPVFKKSKFILWCGENSLTLYLSHLLFLALGMTLATQYFDVSTIDIKTSLIVVSIFLFALGGGALCSIILNKLPILKYTIMPRYWHDWTIIKRTKK